jgi:hypothetical protein
VRTTATYQRYPSRLKIYRCCDGIEKMFLISLLWLDWNRNISTHAWDSHSVSGCPICKQWNSMRTHTLVECLRKKRLRFTAIAAVVPRWTSLIENSIYSLCKENIDTFNVVIMSDHKIMSFHYLIYQIILTEHIQERLLEFE